MTERWVLQVCHGYDGPFLDVARQYAVLFKETSIKVCTVFLTGADTQEARRGAKSDEVHFLEATSRDLRGLKLGVIRDIKKIIGSREFGLVIAHRFKSIYAACLASKLPVIGVHHGFGDYIRRSRRFFANHFRQRLLLLGVSNAVRNEIRSCLPTWPESRIQTLYNRIDADALRGQLVTRAQARELLGISQDAYVIGNAGRLHPDKDQATLIKGFALALSQLPDSALLAIMGAGRLEGELKKLSLELGVPSKVLFLGQVPEGKRYFRAFDVFALTSDHEPFGMVLLEAMAARLPVVCSDCGGGAEVVLGYGDTFPLGDANALAKLLAGIALNGSAQRTLDPHSLQSRFSDSAARARFSLIVKEAGFSKFDLADALTHSLSA